MHSGTKEPQRSGPGGASEGWNERGPLQFLSWVPRLSPGMPELFFIIVYCEEGQAFVTLTLDCIGIAMTSLNPAFRVCIDEV